MVNYREVLVGISNEISILLEKKSLAVASSNSAEKIEGLKLIIDLKLLVAIQDKLINYVALIENKSVSDIQDEFNFRYIF